jgi:Cu+-exporting ATPase
MIHTYKITGMSCDGCRTKVEKTLNAIEGISAVVTLDPPIATITMEKHIPIEQLQTALTAAGNYTIVMFNNQNIADKIETTVETKSCCSSHNKQDADSKTVS